MDFERVSFGLDLDVAKVADQRGVVELLCGAGGEEGDDLHAGAEAGIDAGPGVFKDDAVFWFYAELSGGEEEAFGVGLATLNFIDGNDDGGQRQACGEDAGLGEFAPCRGDECPGVILRLHDVEDFRCAGNCEDAACLGLFELSEFFEIGRVVVAGAELLEGGDGGTAVGEGEDVGQGEIVACCPISPCAFDDGSGVDEGSVHVEEDGFAADFEHGSMVAL